MFTSTHLLQPTLWRKLFPLLCFLAIVTHPSQSFSQSQDQWKLVEMLTTNNGGLPQNSCWDLFFDNKTGFLWISTEGGIVRYNGYDKKIFDLRNVKGMTSTRIGSFITSLDGKTYTYSRPGNTIQIEHSDAKAIESATDISQYGTVSSFDNIDQRLFSNDQVLTQLVNGISIAKPVDIKAISWLNEQEAVVVCKDTCYYSKNGRIVNRWAIGSSYSSPLIKTEKGIYIIGRGQPWQWLDLEKQTIQPIDVPAVLNTVGISIYSRTGRNNNEPLALVGNKLYKIHCKEGSITVTHFANLPGLSAMISSIVINPNNQDIYAGSIYNGLHIYKYSGFYTYRTEKDSLRGDVSGVSMNNIYAAVLVDSTHVYTSTNMLFDLANRTYIDQPGYENKNAQHMYLLGKDEIISYTLPVYNIKTRKTTTNPLLASTRSFLRINDSLHWLAEKDISIYNGHTSRTVFRWKQLPELMQKTLRGENLQYLTIVGETPDHQLLVQDGYHYAVVDTLKQEAVIKFTMKKETSRIAMIDKDGFCWIPTYGDGIYLYDLDADSLYRAPLDMNGYLQHAHTLAPDGHGNLLVPTNYGLFRINRKHLIDACRNGSKNLLYEYYDTKTGLLNIEFNGNCIPAYNITPNGDVLLPSFAGLVRVFTSAFPEKFSYPIFIDQVKTPVNVYSFTNDLALGSNERTLSITLNYAQWSSRYSPSISYRLDDESEWIYLPPGEQNIQLIDLKGGKHILHIKNQSDLLGEKYSSLDFSFSIAKKFYERVSFWILSFLLLCALVALMIYISNKRLKRKNIELEKKIAEKTRVVTDQNIELEHTLAGLNELLAQMETNSKFQKKLMSIIGHDFMVPLQYISKVSGSLQAYKEKLSETTRDESIGEISTTSTSLVYLGQGIIQWIKLQEDDFRLEADYFKLSDTVREIAALHQQLSAYKSNQLQIEIDDNLVLLYDPVAIKIILHNLLINANKFTSRGLISLKCHAEDDQLLIVVTDNGIGMSPEIAASLNNMQAVMSTHGTGNESGWGLGYRLIIDLVNASHGALSIRSEKNKGTEVTIRIPDVI